MRTNDVHIELPTSKSLSNRWLMLNHVLGSPFILRNLSTADDTQLMQTLLSQLSRGNTDLIYCKNAGTVARFLVALLAVTPGDFFISGDERLKQRPMAPLITSLRSMGSQIECTEKEGHLPLHIRGSVPQRKMVELDPSESSQFVSALMLVGPLLPNGITITTTSRAASRPYIEMTNNVLTQAGIANSVSPNRRVYRVDSKDGVALKKHHVIDIERDWSSASFIYAAAALVPGVRLRMPGLTLSNSCQGDRVAAQIFERLGVVTREVRSPYRSNIRSITITGTGQCDPAFEYNFIDCPDLLPAVLVTCAALGIRARLKGVKNLRLKESDRLAALQNELAKMGGQITLTDTEVHIIPRPLHSTPLICHHADHRIAMAFAVLTLRFPDMQIESPEAVSKSFPNFWEQLTLIRKAIPRQPLPTK